MYRQLIPPRNRVPSNFTTYGFNERTDLLLGFPRDSVPHDPEFSTSDGDILDPRRNAAWSRHDLALKYCYDTEMWYFLEGEWVSFPVVRYVYRRHRLLRKSEIIAYLTTGEIPQRYPPRESGGVINEPMNSENFERMTPREELFERTSGLIVQSDHMAFDEVFWSGPSIFCDRSLLTGDPAVILALMVSRYGPRCWYLNGLERVRAACYRVRTGRWEPLPFPGTDLGKETRC
ncbi:hypothetical protein DFH07DRAFT_964103 [Mycena maculata]|uniref:Uncharacterized protein n=1 Tax=Mycena maculata TaxID=230809 RepID=A0AAD7N2H2_9AGAR|nr:hypothetical protein DFH07DRAFT_964103 [Mycena maculata]